MTATTKPSLQRPALTGMRDAIPLLGGYIPVAISFGLVATQAGFSAWEATLISTFIYAGASQFLFVAMVASGAPLWLVVAMTLLINARHVVYGPNLAPYFPKTRSSPWLLHGMTDQIFALALNRLPQLAHPDRLAWFTGAGVFAWFAWIAGTALGAVAGQGLTEQWPLLGSIMPFALPALFIVLMAPRFTSLAWTLTLLLTIVTAIAFKLAGYPNAAIPLAALAGGLLYYAVNGMQRARGAHDVD